MKYETWQEFFKQCDDDSIELRNYGDSNQVTTEDLYQHFKARLVDELMAKSPELLAPVPLIDTKPPTP